MNKSVRTMKNIVEELKKVVRFKDTTIKGDLVLIVSKDPQFLAYALVTEIEKDTSRKKDWWNIHMQLLTIPPQEIIWTLREPQYTGNEIFSMDGSERFVKAVSFAENKDDQVQQQNTVNEKVNSDSQTNPFRIVK